MHLLLIFNYYFFTLCNLFLRLFATFHLCETSFWRRRTTRRSAGHLEISCSFWCRGLANLCASFGIPETSRPTFLRTRCCRLWCSAAKRTSKLPSKVMSWAMSLYCLYYIWRISAGTVHWWGKSQIQPYFLLNVTFALLLTIVLHVFKCCYSCYI